MSMKFSQACENNQEPILQVLSEYFASATKVLEIGSGTGQHAVYFAPRLPHLTWQCSDVVENHESILAWQTHSPSVNVVAPLEFCVGQHAWPIAGADAVFTANTTHIMQRDEAKLMMQMVAQHLPKDGVFCQYGPFNVGGQYTSLSNQEFDRNLRAGGYGGICDIEELVAWAVTDDAELQLREHIQMPANNMILVWGRS